jgi:hypothetical protein
MGGVGAGGVDQADARRRASVDREGLLAALVLSPATYSRNRFFELYRDPEIRRVRRRATHIRGVVRHLLGTSPKGAPALEMAPAGEGRVELCYQVAALGLRRTVVLDPLELSLVRFALARAEGPGLPAAGDPDRARVEAALARLRPQLADGTLPPPG